VVIAGFKRQIRLIKMFVDAITSKIELTYSSHAFSGVVSEYFFFLVTLHSSDDLSRIVHKKECRFNTFFNS